MTHSPSYFLWLGTNLITKRDRSRVSVTTAVEHFKSNFKVHPDICSKLWRLLKSRPTFPAVFQQQHLLWALFLMKTFSPTFGQRGMADILGCDRKTLRSYVWPLLRQIERLRHLIVSFLHASGPVVKSLHSIILAVKIKWENRLIHDNGSIAKVTVDGTDFQTIEYMPFNPGRKSHKFDGPGLRYEVALAIKTGWIVHINGPFLCGAWPDLRIARNKLHYMLPPGEKYLADVGYMCYSAPSITKQECPAHERDAVNSLLARHETVNTRFKDWGILKNKYTLEEDKHRTVFYAIAVITQIEIVHGRFNWGYNRF